MNEGDFDVNHDPEASGSLKRARGRTERDPGKTSQFDQGGRGPFEYTFAAHGRAAAHWRELPPLALEAARKTAHTAGRPAFEGRSGWLLE